LDPAFSIDRGLPKTFERRRDAAHVTNLLAHPERFALGLNGALVIA
jgi:hypothetical protein